MKCTTLINGHTWAVRILRPREFSKLHGNKDAAVAIADSRTIDICKGFGDNTITVRHEVTHAFISYLYLDAAGSLTNGDMEEIICELIGHRLDDIVFVCNDIQTKLRIKR